MTIPAPGDYDGSGKTEIAAYLPTLGLFAYRPAGGGADVVIPFGTANDGTIPVPGDYDGSGKTDIAIYDPNYAAFAYRPSLGGADVITVFGAAGLSNSIPVAAPPLTVGTGGTVQALAIPVTRGAAVPSGPVLAAAAARRPGRTLVAQGILPSSSDLG